MMARSPADTTSWVLMISTQRIGMVLSAGSSGWDAGSVTRISDWGVRFARGVRATEMARDERPRSAAYVSGALRQSGKPTSEAGHQDTAHPTGERCSGASE